MFRIHAPVIVVPTIEAEQALSASLRGAGQAAYREIAVAAKGSKSTSCNSPSKAARWRSHRGSAAAASSRSNSASATSACPGACSPPSRRGRPGRRFGGAWAIHDLLAELGSNILILALEPDFGRGRAGSGLRCLPG